MSIHSDGTMKIWDTSSGEYRFSVIPSIERLEKLSHYAGPDKSVSILNDNSVGLWVRDLDGSYKLYSKLEGHGEKIECLFVLQNGMVVSSSNDSTIVIWDWRTGEIRSIYLESGESVNSLIDIGYNRIASSDSLNETIKIWDLSSCQCEYVLSGHTDFVNCLMNLPTPQGPQGPVLHKIVSGSCDKTVRIWDLNNMQCELILLGHNAPVSCLSSLSVSTELESQHVGNGFFVSGSWDGVFKIWNGMRGECLGTILVKLGPVSDFLKIKEPGD